MLLLNGMVAYGEQWGAGKKGQLGLDMATSAAFVKTPTLVAALEGHHTTMVFHSSFLEMTDHSHRLRVDNPIQLL